VVNYCCCYEEHERVLANGRTGEEKRKGGGFSSEVEWSGEESDEPRCQPVTVVPPVGPARRRPLLPATHLSPPPERGSRRASQCVS
jgi:hypothetical protein